jgi:hypothetical protein
LHFVIRYCAYILSLEEGNIRREGWKAKAAPFAFTEKMAIGHETFKKNRHFAQFSFAFLCKQPNIARSPKNALAHRGELWYNACMDIIVYYISLILVRRNR